MFVDISLGGRRCSWIVLLKDSASSFGELGRSNISATGGVELLEAIPGSKKTGIF